MIALVTTLINIAWRLTELSARFAFQLLGFMFGLAGKLLIAAMSSYAQSKEAKRQKPLRHRNRRRARE